MSNKYKCVQINLEESLYNFLKEYLETFIPDTDISYFLKCLCINRLQDIGVLNECGLPNEYVLGPKLDLSALPNVDMSNITNKE